MIQIGTEPCCRPTFLKHFESNPLHAGYFSSERRIVLWHLRLVAILITQWPSFSMTITGIFSAADLKTFEKQITEDYIA